jgi:hypothetical protein
MVVPPKSAVLNSATPLHGEIIQTHRQPRAVPQISTHKRKAGMNRGTFKTPQLFLDKLAKLIFMVFRNVATTFQM